MPDDMPQRPPGMPDAVHYHYKKSVHFRVIPVEGAYGGLNGQGSISVSLYNQRRAIPSETKQTVNPDGTLGAEEAVAQKEHFVRELEANLLMSPEAARIIGQWLIGKANEHDVAIMRKSPE